MGKKSKEKGKRGERDLAKKLNSLFNVSARRGQQYKGAPDAPDVIAFDDIHIECKRVEKFNAYNAMNQAEDDAGNKVPIVLHKRNYKPWLVVVKLDDLPELIRILEEYL